MSRWAGARTAAVLWLAGTWGGCATTKGEGIPLDGGAQREVEDQRDGDVDGTPGASGLREQPPDAGPETGPEEVGLVSCFDPGLVVEAGPGDSFGGDVGEDCEVTADCREPFLCVAGACVAPGPGQQWCDGIDVTCPNDGTECLSSTCVFPVGICAGQVDCPIGYHCRDQRCRPAQGDCYTDRDCPAGELCDYGRCVLAADCVVTQDLRGSWEARSLLHLREAAQGLTAVILGTAERTRNLLEGRSVLPVWAFLLEEPLREYLDRSLLPYQKEAIIALGDVSDLLDEVSIEHQLTFDAMCREIYRGLLTFEAIEVPYKGSLLTAAPEAIPAIGSVPPAALGATLRCDHLALDEFRVDHLLAGLVRWLSDAVVQQVTEGEYWTMEELLQDLFDCEGFLEFLADEWEIEETELSHACSVIRSALVSTSSQALERAVLHTRLMRIKGLAQVADDRSLTEGQWIGSVVTGDFSGEFSAHRR